MSTAFGYIGHHCILWVPGAQKNDHSSCLNFRYMCIYMIHICFYIERGVFKNYFRARVCGNGGIGWDKVLDD